mgnify:CR=1 FL=1
MPGTRKLGKTTDQRKAMLRQLTTDLLENGKLETTFCRAKEVQPVAEKMITLGKKGDLAAYVRPLSDPKFLICVVVLSLFCSILCNNMVNYAAGKMSVVKLSSLGSLTTLCSMFAGVVLLHEPLTPALLLGSVLILVGIRQVTKQQ